MIIETLDAMMIQMTLANEEEKWHQMPGKESL